MARRNGKHPTARSPAVSSSDFCDGRFLCPPPTAIMIGNSWWSEASRRGEEPRLCAPRVTVSISGEPSPPESSVDWTGSTGKTFDASEPPSGTTYTGRCVGKQLFISDVDEKKKKVEALVKIAAPTFEDEPERVIGVFPSRPIKVISKPSKKRQSAKNLERMLLSILLVFSAVIDVTICPSRFDSSLHQPRLNDITLPSPQVPDGFHQVPLRFWLWIIIQGLRRCSLDGIGSSLSIEHTFLHRQDLQLGYVTPFLSELCQSAAD